MNKHPSARRAHPLTERECLILDRIGRDRTHKDIAAELGVSINTIANLAAKAYRKLGAHSAAAAVLAHRDAHPWCKKRVDFGPVLRERTPCREAQHDQRLERTDRGVVVLTVCRESVAHLVFEQTEDRPAVNHAGEVPLLRTDAGFVEVLPHPSG